MTAFLEPIPSTNSIDPSSSTIAVFPLCASENPVALLSALLAFRLLPAGFANRQLREHPLMGLSTETYSPNRATYDLRRLRLRGLVERIPHSHRYRVTGTGMRIALCYQRIHRRILSPALGTVFDEQTGPLIQRFDHEIQRLWEGHSVAM